jgi:hypothetical protein
MAKMCWFCITLLMMNNCLMFELMLKFKVATQNMRTRISLRSLLSLLEDIDTSTYLPSETEVSSSSTRNNGDA